MIYARVDVELRDHGKAQQAGQAMATWTWALLWTRAKEENGFVAASALRGSWVGEKQAVRDMAKLVDVGLASVADAGWVLFGYAAKNETREQIEERRADTRERKSRSRAKPEAGHATVTRDTTTKSHVTDVGVTLPYPEPESEPEPKRGEASAPPPPATKVNRGSRLPGGWEPSEATIATLKGEGIQQPLACLATFRDWWKAAPGQKGVKLDWEATYRNWVRRDNTGGPSRFPTKPNTLQGASEAQLFAPYRQRTG